MLLLASPKFPVEPGLRHFPLSDKWHHITFQGFILKNDLNKTYKNSLWVVLGSGTLFFQLYKTNFFWFGGMVLFQNYAIWPNKAGLRSPINLLTGYFSIYYKPKSHQQFNIIIGNLKYLTILNSLDGSCPKFSDGERLFPISAKDIILI